MRFLSLAAAVTATVGVVASAQPHHQHHKHMQKRVPTQVEDIIEVPGPTVIIYELNGQVISDAEVQEGIKNGSLIWASGTLVTSSSSIFIAPSTAVTSLEPSTTTEAVVEETSSTSTSSATPTTTSTVISSTSSTSSTSTSSSSSSTSTSSTTSSTSTSTSTETTSSSSSITSTIAAASATSTSSGVGSEFPTGEIACSDFPSSYGAVALDYLGLGGWAGIQIPGSSDDGFSDILTVTTSTCTDGDCCTEGAYCSYACPAGYQKSQWPTEQGSTGQSVGGILCKNGYLELTNPSLSSSLCITGTTAVTVQVQNNMAEDAAVCRTDYPGTESETIPLDAAAGTTNPLTCPNAATYYTWEGSETSAQYYVNPAGISTETACQWGNSSDDWGNYAPLNLGVGYSDGLAYLSIFQNSPTTSAKLDFTVELVGDDGGYDNLNGRCKYSNGEYCSGDGYTDCSSTTGCTISLSSGTATYVFSSS